MPDNEPFARFLRGLPVFANEPPPFDADALIADPADLFRGWLRDAVAAGVEQPHAATLSTVDQEGVPDGRVLILKDLDDDGWWFASSAASAKGVQLAARPAAALTFYWASLGRQVRARGPVAVGQHERSAADFAERSASARAVALASRQSDPLESPQACTGAVKRAAASLDTDPHQIDPRWTVYAVIPDTVELWQADRGRQHRRVQYVRTTTGWRHGLLWP